MFVYGASEVRCPKVLPVLRVVNERRVWELENYQSAKTLRAICDTLREVLADLRRWHAEFHKEKTPPPPKNTWRLPSRGDLPNNQTNSHSASDRTSCVCARGGLPATRVRRFVRGRVMSAGSAQTLPVFDVF